MSSRTWTRAEIVALIESAEVIYRVVDVDQDHYTLRVPSAHETSEGVRPPAGEAPATHPPGGGSGLSRAPFTEGPCLSSTDIDHADARHQNTRHGGPCDEGAEIQMTNRGPLMEAVGLKSAIGGSTASRTSCQIWADGQSERASTASTMMATMSPAIADGRRDQNSSATRESPVSAVETKAVDQLKPTASSTQWPDGPGGPESTSMRSAPASNVDGIRPSPCVNPATGLGPGPAEPVTTSAADYSAWDKLEEYLDNSCELTVRPYESAGLTIAIQAAVEESIAKRLPAPITGVAPGPVACAHPEMTWQLSGGVQCSTCRAGAMAVIADLRSQLAANRPGQGMVEPVDEVTRMQEATCRHGLPISRCEKCKPEPATSAAECTCGSYPDGTLAWSPFCKASEHPGRACDKPEPTTDADDEALRIAVRNVSTASLEQDAAAIRAYGQAERERALMEALEIADAYGTLMESRECCVVAQQIRALLGCEK